MRPRRLSLEERLDVLRKLDHERRWGSLDDRRVCIICNRIFSGRQVDVERARGGDFQLHCPTPGCPSNITHWFFSRLKKETRHSAKELVPLTNK